jgi:hypothetical protein
MKAEIDSKKTLILIPETVQEAKDMFNWIDENSGKVTVPANREDLAFIKFDKIKIAVTR